ncbi:hypothetical protein [Candidatus Formimonas warabiya]|uniref:Uncharacterized protein n=1 Tax=Formimonas warabiya TaxID=1761012 RepID=A0A3G1KSK8_FORW1|nr:hypothetical protein [Candidatus Formimonas warabiya]ATW25416.1 hypothetical protein DCMF_12105 [Candidatus Formimonas warabiya]
MSNEKTGEEKGSAGQGRILDAEELGAVTGGEGTPPIDRCPFWDKDFCHGNGYTCTSYYKDKCPYV